MPFFRSNSITRSVLSFMLVLTMALPAQSMMLWCDMMDMDMDHESMPMEMHAMSGDMLHLCDVQNQSSADEHSAQNCEDMVDCNCLLPQAGNTGQAALTVSPNSYKLLIGASLPDLLFIQSSPKELIPPPIWMFSSYSPPSIFLANESFLI